MDKKRSGRENLRIKRHKVFQNVAQRGKSSTGWFYGFKLHAVITHQGEILAIKLTLGNSDDHKELSPLLIQNAGLKNKKAAVRR